MCRSISKKKIHIFRSKDEDKDMDPSADVGEVYFYCNDLLKTKINTLLQVDQIGRYSK